MQTINSLELQNKELHMTLSRLSHELRNPLALLSSQLQLMASNHPEIASSDNYEDILENLEYIKELLNELSTYNNARRLTLIPTEPASFLRTVLSSVRPTLNYLGILLETDIPESLPIISLDQVKMRQALLNILRNAQEAVSMPNGKISVKAAAVPSGLHLSIRDNGCGIDEVQLKEIFLPFVTHKANGTGLGLAITRQIIEAHGGRIRADSIPGSGSTFHIFLG